MTWTQLYGQWLEQEGTLIQSDLDGITRCWQNISHTNFIAQFRFRMTQCTPQNDGEVKFILTEADVEDRDHGERRRIDFMYGPSMCRVFSFPDIAAEDLPLQINRSYFARIALKSTLVSVHVDGMPIIRNYDVRRPSNGHIGFGTYRAAAELSEINIAPYSEKKCFVVMPFDPLRDMLYDLVIEPVLSQHPSLLFRCTRADKALTVDRISEEIEKGISDADVIIADITENNRNVFYELGLARMAKKKAILLIQKVEGQKLDIPFDIADFRCHGYQYTSTGFNELKDRLTDLLSNVLIDYSKNAEGE
jgi:hypothetical protein